MSKEKTYLKGNDFEVTSTKVVVKNIAFNKTTTFALRNISGTSVGCNNGKTIGIVGGFACVLLALWFLYIEVPLLGFFLVAIGVLFFFLANDTYYVEIASGGIKLKQNETVCSQDKSHIEKIVQAINGALLDLDALNISEPSKSSQKEGDSSSIDELKKFKSLLDDGVITQEDFDAKKKEILGL